MRYAAIVIVLFSFGASCTGLDALVLNEVTTLVSQRGATEMRPHRESGDGEEEIKRAGHKMNREQRGKIATGSEQRRMERGRKCGTGKSAREKESGNKE